MCSIGQDLSAIEFSDEPNYLLLGSATKMVILRKFCSFWFLTSIHFNLEIKFIQQIMFNEVRSTKNFIRPKNCQLTHRGVIVLFDNFT